MHVGHLATRSDAFRWIASPQGPPRITAWLNDAGFTNRVELQTRQSRSPFVTS
jgi:hypothetical protein